MINSAHDMLTVALADGEKSFVRSFNEGNKKHNSLLMPAVENLLAEAEVSKNKLNFVGAVTGPGSFTGIRIGVTAANALSFAFNIPLIDVNSFELEAYNIDGECLCAVDALHGNYYCAQCEGGRVVNAWFSEDKGLPENARLYDQTREYGTELLAIARGKAQKGEISAQLLPMYLRASQAEREATVIAYVPMNSTHIADVAEIERQSFNTPWTYNMLLSELSNKLAHYIVAEHGGKAVGYCGYYQVLTDAYITNIAVCPNFRKQHIAKSLLEKIIVHAAHNGAAQITLEVNEHNDAAIAFYEKMGFEKSGRRKKYYEGTDDAIIYWLNISG